MQNTKTPKTTTKASAPSEAVRTDPETLKFLKYQQALAPSPHRAAVIEASSPRPTQPKASNGPSKYRGILKGKIEGNDPAAPQPAHRSTGVSEDFEAIDRLPQPKESDAWEPLREKLTIAESQYLNTYIDTGDISAITCLVLNILKQRDQQERFKWRANDRADKAAAPQPAKAAQDDNPTSRKIREAFKLGKFEGRAELKAELERVKAERDELADKCAQWSVKHEDNCKTIGNLKSELEEANKDICAYRLAKNMTEQQRDGLLVVLQRISECTYGDRRDISDAAQAAIAAAEASVASEPKGGCNNGYSGI